MIYPLILTVALIGNSGHVAGAETRVEKSYNLKSDIPKILLAYKENEKDLLMASGVELISRDENILTVKFKTTKNYIIIKLKQNFVQSEKQVIITNVLLEDPSNFLAEYSIDVTFNSLDEGTNVKIDSFISCNDKQLKSRILQLSQSVGLLRMEKKLRQILGEPLEDPSKLIIKSEENKIIQQ